MFHAIGRKQDPTDDLVDLLLACHGRIRTFTDLAIAVAARSDASDDEVALASARIERYFSEALPLHVEDEEASILPRLRGRSPELDAALDRMAEEHERHELLLRRLLEVCASVRLAPRDRRARADMARTAAELRAEFDIHLEAEERVVMPAIRALLTNEEQRAIVGELRARRQRR